MTVEEKNRVEGRSRKKPKVDLGIAIDFGGSMTKIMAGLPNGQWCGVTMEPEVVEISLATVAAFERKSLGQGRAKDRAWVKVGEKVYAVGYLAREFLGDAGLWRPKVELAIYKLLAALWFLKEYWHLKDKLTVSIACLLPPGEYEERDLLEQKVREVLSIATAKAVRTLCEAHLPSRPEDSRTD